MTEEVTTEDRLLTVMKDAEARRQDAAKDYEAAKNNLLTIVRGRLRRFCQENPKGIHIETREVSFHGVILKHWPSTFEHLEGIMFVIRGMEEIWQVGREMDLMSSIQNSREQTTYAIHYSLDTLGRIESALMMLNDPVRVSVR